MEGLLILSNMTPPDHGQLRTGPAVALAQRRIVWPSRF